MPIKKYTSKERRCCICKEMKPLDSFSTDNTQPFGKSYMCRQCKNIKSAIYRKLHGKRELRLRWLILHRDNFTCQYCGRKAPDVILNIDHIFPVSKGGKTIEKNLITACVDCNLGKSNLLI